MLKGTMPGLVSSTTESTINANLSTVAVDDRLSGMGHHRLLITPDAFHVSILFQPTQEFLRRITDSISLGDESPESDTMLEEFVLKVYLPQLEEKVSTLFHQAVTGMHLPVL